MFDDITSFKKNYKSGDIIAKEEQVSSECFILIQGHVGVFKNKIKLAEYYEKGTLFGEMSMLLSSKRTATLIAMEDTELLVIRNNDLEELIKRYPKIAKNIIINLAERLKNTTDNLIIFSTDTYK